METRPSLGLLHRSDHEPLGINPVNSRGHDHIARSHVGQVRDEIHAERRIAVDADRHASGSRAFGDGAGSGVPVDDQLDACRVAGDRTDDASNHAFRCDHGHVSLNAVGAAAIDGHGHQPRIGIAGDDLRRQGRKRRALPQVQDGLQAVGARGERSLFLQPDFEFGHLLLERKVLGLDPTQTHVTAPDVADTANEARSATLNAREDAKRDPFEHRDASLRLHLRRDEDEVADHHRAEENPGTLAVWRAGGKVDHGSSQLTAVSSSQALADFNRIAFRLTSEGCWLEAGS